MAEEDGHPFLGQIRAVACGADLVGGRSDPSGGHLLGDLPWSLTGLPKERLADLVWGKS